MINRFKKIETGEILLLVMGEVLPIFLGYAPSKAFLVIWRVIVVPKQFLGTFLDSWFMYRFSSSLIFLGLLNFFFDSSSFLEFSHYAYLSRLFFLWDFFIGFFILFIFGETCGAMEKG